MNPANQMRVEVSRPTKRGPESIPQFWNPGLFGIRLAPEDFRSKLHAIDASLEATWNPETSRWQVFFQSPRATHPLCRNWVLLFIVHDGQGGYVPLDERTLAKCYQISGYRWRDGRQYWDSVMREQERDKAKAEQADQEATNDQSGEYWDYAYKPKVGYGPISASKMIGQ